MEFDSYLAIIKKELQTKGIYITFIEGDFGLGCPPFGCNFDESVQAAIIPSKIELVGYDRIIIYKSFNDYPIGVCLENINDKLYSKLEQQKMFYGQTIASIDKTANMCYIKFI
ncbi:MAG: hypothetical protein IJ277_00355 [Bacteroidaceae bacterium]|nr:hypothetical protein [Bacteroidaceae bacterium]